MNHQMQFEALLAAAKRAGLDFVRLYNGDYLVIKGTTLQASGLPAARAALQTVIRGGAPPLKPWHQFALNLDQPDTHAGHHPAQGS